jgi:hypothetical protein
MKKVDLQHGLFNLRVEIIFRKGCFAKMMMKMHPMTFAKQEMSEKETLVCEVSLTPAKRSEISYPTFLFPFLLRRQQTR